jgi:hypothetical protein
LKATCFGIDIENNQSKVLTVIKRQVKSAIYKTLSYLLLAEVDVCDLLKKNTAGSIYNCTAKDVDVTTLSRRTSTVVNGTLLEQ